MNTLIALGAPIAVLLAFLATRPASPAREARLLAGLSEPELFALAAA